MRQQYSHADAVETASGTRTVFNIKGNDYRLIVGINYRASRIYIKDLLTHAEYDRGRWKE